MANAYRGEVDLKIGEQTLTLLLTLQGLAELENAFGVSDLTALGERFLSGRLSTQDIIKIVGIAIRGGGLNKTDAEIALMIPASILPQVITAITELLNVTFGSEQQAEYSTKNPI